MNKNIFGSILELHEKSVDAWHKGEEVKIQDDFLNLVLKQHRLNYELWHQEDNARRKDVTDTVIAGLKRKIDSLNQQRNDFIEKVDEFLYSRLFKEMNEKAKLNSETPGSMIDRLSILSLKIYHMAEEFNRKDVDDEHVRKCREKIEVLKRQKSDLFNCLIELYEDLLQGRRRFNVYRQFKMYNDPELNPEVYKRKSSESKSFK